MENDSRSAKMSRVVCDAERVACFWPNGFKEAVLWTELEEISIVTSDEGPLADDLVWILAGKDDTCTVPGSASGIQQMLARLQDLPGFDNEAVVAAMASTANATFVCWKDPTDTRTAIEIADEELRESIALLPNQQLSAFVVLEEDEYETKLGDGYYAYLRDTFFLKELAQAYVVNNQQSGITLHIREITLRLENGEYQLTAEMLEGEQAPVDKVVAALLERLAAA
jgi:hypothetical protein